jgi:hypothetical protein
MKHYRLGKTTIDGLKVRSSRSATLVGQIMDRPGQYVVKQNSSSETDNIKELITDCSGCYGNGLVVDYYPENFLSNNPLPSVENSSFCCNQVKKALKRVRGASTIIPRNYYTTLQQYRQSRCQTYDQRIFNFSGSIADTKNNMYRANCYPYTASYTNGIGPTPTNITTNVTTCSDGTSLNSVTHGTPLCSLVAYKPNNAQFATQGAVSSSTRLLKLTLATIRKDVAGQQNLIGHKNKNFVNTIPVSSTNPTPFINKSKNLGCTKTMYTLNGNFRSCSTMGYRFTR